MKPYFCKYAINVPLHGHIAGICRFETIQQRNKFIRLISRYDTYKLVSFGAEW